MRVIVFAGPTISKEQVIEILPDAIVLPPAEQGDVDFARFSLGADAILLIDGVHRQRLPVWHKEILGVLKDGCRFIGASSMGALRAVECEPWGAEPVGEVAGWYRDEYIDADDEVCLSHGDSSTGYKQLSLPMVNIRASLTSAKIDPLIQTKVIAEARKMFYAERSWPVLFKRCPFLTGTEKSDILEFELDIKAIDAITALHYVGSSGSPSGCNYIKNHNKGYGGVFLGNDRKRWTGSKVVREHEIAHAGLATGYNALNRALALEFCKATGIYTVSDVDDPDRIKNEEAALLRARDWLANAASGFKTAPAINDFLRAIGAYEEVKGQIK